MPQGKYRPLYAALVENRTADPTFSFCEIERILGLALPASARRYSAWWRNDASSGHSHARAWLSGRQAQVNLGRGTVVFRRDRVAP